MHQIGFPAFGEIDAQGRPQPARPAALKAGKQDYSTTFVEPFSALKERYPSSAQSGCRIVNRSLVATIFYSKAAGGWRRNHLGFDKAEHTETDLAGWLWRG
jgi:hypothetical protein